MPHTHPTGTNAHVVLLGKERIEVQYRPIPTVKNDEVLVKVMATGLCGTDVSFYTRGGIGSRVVSQPLVLGHESAGIIHAIGSDVTEVAIEHGLDVVIDATGAEPCMQLAVALLRPGGTLILAGMGPPLTRFPTLEVASKELSISGSLRYTTRCFEDGIHLVERGLVDLAPLVTKTVPLCKAEEAFKAARSGPLAGGEMKVVVMNQE
ncbi:hypothetical protein CspHIS471_0105560 [Cutaneotrichosporon sp. HIS471]|nr:hypothetical protein CspHIS471_0105560 [Cutaneotrichosporon sp. HIS471]